MTEGPRVNFVMRERFSKFTRGSSVFHTSMRNKQVEFNSYIYTLSKLYRFCYEISVFLIQKHPVIILRGVILRRYTVSCHSSWKNGY